VKKLILTAVGILMIPMLFALTATTFSEVGYVLGSRTYSTGLNHWIFIGIAVYAAGFVFFEKTSIGGVFRWEGIEALWRKAIGKRSHVKEEEEGEEAPPQPAKPLRVVPYCIPLYALGALIAVGLLYWSMRRMSHYPEIFGFVLGFFYSHHLAWIGKDIRRDHPDIKVAGKVLTPAVIYLVNVEIILIVLALIVNRGRLWLDVNHKAFDYSIDTLKSIWDWIRYKL